MPTLFAISADMQALAEMMEAALDNENDTAGSSVLEAEAAVKAQLEALKGQEAEKLGSYALVIKRLEAEAAIADAQAREWQKKKQRREGQIRWLKGAVLTHLKATGKASIRTDNGYVLAVRKNGGKPPLNVNDDLYTAYDDAIPERFKTVVKKFDLEAIRTAVENGDDQDLPPGFAEIGTPGDHLRIT